MKNEDEPLGSNIDVPADVAMDAYFREIDHVNEPVTAPEPGVVVAPPPVSQIPPEVEQELTDLRRVSRAVGIIKDPEFISYYVQPVQSEYVSAVGEMAQYFSADPERVKSDFTDPLLTQWNPQQLTMDWVESQISLMEKASDVTKERVRRKWQHIFEGQKAQEQRAQELASAETYDAIQQERRQRQVSDAVRAEINNALEESEFQYWAALRKRVAEGESEAQIEMQGVDDADFGLPAMIDVLLQKGVPPGTAVRRALRQLAKRKGDAQKELRQEAQSKPTKFQPSESKHGLRRDVEAAFAEWDPQETKSKGTWSWAHQRYE